MFMRQAFSASLFLQNVAIFRGNRLVLQNFSMDVSSGDIVWIRGANGSGKSTLLRLVAGLLTKAGGEMKVEGAIALADENMALDVGLPLRKALNIWAGLDRAAADLHDAALDAMDLADLTDVPIRYLSSGQRKRAGLARMLASNAAIWLLDEPYNGLDSANSTRLDAALLQHANSGGIALVAAHQAPSINVAQSVLLDRQSRTV